MDDSSSPRRKHLTLLRSMTPADFLTLGNGAAGMTAVLLSIRYAGSKEPRWLWIAFAMLPLALLLDVFDGYVARHFARQSPWGGDMDSLADIVSFGVAPAAMGYTLGLQGVWDILILAVFVGCGISRLARFNVTAASLTTDTGKVSHFEGTPIPTTLAIAGLLAVAFAQGAVHTQIWGGSVRIGWVLHPFTLIYALSGALMTTATLRIPKP